MHTVARAVWTSHGEPASPPPSFLDIKIPSLLGTENLARALLASELQRGLFPGEPP